MSTAGPAPVAAIGADELADLTDPEAFQRVVVDRCAPLVLRGAFRDWPLVRMAAQSDAAAAHYLRDRAADRSAEVFVGDPAIAGRYYYSDDLAGFNFARETMPLRAAFDRMLESAAAPDRPSLYLGSLPAGACLPTLAHDNPPSFVPPHVEPRLWAGSRSHVSCHYDTFENLAVVAAGRRRFTLYPPEAIAGLYVGPLDRTMAGQPVGLADGTPPGDLRYPDFAAIRDTALEADLAPGDALFLPKLWWHRVEATGPFNVLVNYWWDAFGAGRDAPFVTMLLAMNAIAARPPREREAWRAFFDHYVFREQGHPLRHLPEAQHGILDARDPGNQARIRSFAMRALRGE